MKGHSNSSLVLAWCHTLESNCWLSLDSALYISSTMHTRARVYSVHAGNDNRFGQFMGRLQCRFQFFFQLKGVHLCLTMSMTIMILPMRRKLCEERHHIGVKKRRMCRSYRSHSPTMSTAPWTILPNVLERQAMSHRITYLHCKPKNNKK